MASAFELRLQTDIVLPLLAAALLHRRSASDAEETPSSSALLRSKCSPTGEVDMSEAESLGSSSGSDEIAFSQLLASVARPIPQPFASSPWGSGTKFRNFLSLPLKGHCEDG
ncbi:hypothetical protein TELCIR_03008 [Teladorsagia circumcincta]|uniref:Uncharacterized protein n=1 Tax=Teladorsagia circumcincta TaxID=45464 RepID=A0A2G9UXL5_TELCI|nr:hypothetical protein TELCIR_03008 [Teladorsagia circumcincta]